MNNNIPKNTLRAIGSMSMLPLFLLAVLVVPADLHGQNDIKSILKVFKNYRYGNISIYEIKNPNLNNMKKILSAGQNNKQVNKAALTRIDPQIVRAIENCVKRSNPRTKQKVIECMQNLGITVTPDIDDAIVVKIDQMSGPKGPKIEKIYAVTTREPIGKLPTIIALIYSTKTKDEVEDNLRTVSDNNILTIDELKAFDLDTTYSSNTLYEYVENAIVQNAVKNVTADAQGITGLADFLPPTVGDAKSLTPSEAVITNDDIQKFLRISEGRPLDYTRPHEVVASYDLISYRKYRPDFLPFGFEEEVDPGDDPGQDDAGDEEQFEEEPIVYNNSLPLYGVELRYGMEEINYPSFWSERMNLNFIWSNAKLGVILPTSGWASLSEDFGQDRRLTHAGFGVNAQFDFPVRIIPKSGVFHVAVSYVFDDAEESSLIPNRPDKDPATFAPNTARTDYLVRFTSQLHYTFGIAVDQDHQFRFGLGGTIYSMEKWWNDLKTETDSDGNTVTNVVFTDYETEAVGGISGKIEYMAKNTATPYGVSVQYFDEAFYTGFWLLVPISQEFSARIDARGYTTAFRDAREWEQSSVFIPSISAIWNF